MWQYKVLVSSIESDGENYYDSDIEELNELGKEGWELVSVIPDYNDSSKGLFFFKRRLETIKL